MGDQPFHVVSNAEVWSMLEKIDDDVREVKSEIGQLKAMGQDHENRMRGVEAKKRIEAKDILIILAVIGGTAATAIMRAVGVG